MRAITGYQSGASEPDGGGDAGGLSEWVARLLDKDPARRPSAAELAAALAEVS